MPEGSSADSPSEPDPDEVQRELARHRAMLLRWALRRLEPQQAEDLVERVQELATHQIRVLGRPPRGAGAVAAILRRCFILEARGQSIAPAPIQTRGRIPLEMLEELPWPWGGQASHRPIVDSETRRRYEDALAELPDDERQAVVLRLEMGFAYVEIARAIGVLDAAAARMLVSRGLVRLARRMGEL